MNFFVTLPPVALRDMPQTYMVMLRIPAGQADLSAKLVRESPNLMVVDTELILQQMQGVLDQMTATVEFLFVSTLVVDILVLHAAFPGLCDERLCDADVLRVLDTGSGMVRQTQYVEVLTIGDLAGLMAGLGAIAVG